MGNWIWLHPGASEPDDVWSERFARLRAAGIRGALTLVYDGTSARYGSSQHEVRAPVLEQLLPLAAAEGVDIHAWIVCLRCNLRKVQQDHPEWFSVSRSGLSSLSNPPYIPSYQWLCPSRPEVSDYLRRTVSELAAYTELKGVHLDYIRHPDVILPEALQPKYDLVQDREYPEFDFCYCPICREAFAAQGGRDPLEMPDPTEDPDWRKFRQAAVTRVVAEAADAARQAGKQITAAVFATPELARTYVRQDWPSWDLDAVFPMMYHQYYARPPEWIEEATRGGVAELSGRCPLYSGLFIGALDPDELVRTSDLARGAGAAGVCIFSQAGMTEGHWDALVEA